jgi:hypothetical protein
VLARRLDEPAGSSSTNTAGLHAGPGRSPRAPGTRPARQGSLRTARHNANTCARSSRHRGRRSGSCSCSPPMPPRKQPIELAALNRTSLPEVLACSLPRCPCPPLVDVLRRVQRMPARGLRPRPASDPLEDCSQPCPHHAPRHAGSPHGTPSEKQHRWHSSWQPCLVSIRCSAICE